MPRPTRAELNEEIVETAVRLFSRQGYEATPLHQIATAMGYSKAAVLYHFSSKEALLVAALDATATAAEAILDEVEREPPGPDRDRLAITRLLGLALDHRVRLGLLFDTTRDASAHPSLERFHACADRMHRLLLPPDASLDRRVRSTQMEGGLLAAIVEFADVPTEQLRPLLLRSALRTMGLDEGDVPDGD